MQGSAPSARRDLAIVAVVTAAFACLAVRFDLSEVLFRITRRGEALQLDELPGVLLVLALCLAWFAGRRFAEARREVQRRRELEAQLQGALAENRRLASKYVEVQETERRALARDLHDELGQYLNAIKIDAVGLRDGRQAGPQSHDALAAMIAHIDTVQASVLGLIRQLRPAGLDEFGLAGALEHCVNEWRRRLPGVQFTVAVGEELDGLGESQRLTLYRLVQEALTNIARHAQAAHVAIRVASDPGSRAVLASIEDDGRGSGALATASGLGLVGMRERVEALGGALSLSSPPGGGFVVRARIPWPESP